MSKTFDSLFGDKHHEIRQKKVPVTLNTMEWTHVLACLDRQSRLLSGDVRDDVVTIHNSVRDQLLKTLHHDDPLQVVK